MDGPDPVRTLVVGPGPLDEDAMVLLSRARTVLGPHPLLAAVAHLCPPTTELVATTGPSDAHVEAAEPPVVRLVSSPDQRRG